MPGAWGEVVGDSGENGLDASEGVRDIVSCVVEEETSEVRKKMRAEREGREGAPRYGSAALKDLWDSGFKDLSQLEVMMRS